VCKFSATLKPDTVSLEESAFMATNNAGNNKTRLGIRKKSPIFLRDLTKFGFSPQIFIGVPNWNLHEILSRGRRVDTCGQTNQIKQLLLLSNVLTHKKIL
jgi:hypothetical protein